MNPDPLGALGGDLAADIATFSSDNNNTFSGNEINLAQGNKSLTLMAGNYYLVSVNLNNKTTLTIDTSDGPVNLYLVGPFTAQSGSTINYTSFTSVVPKDFTIFSNSDQPITLLQDGRFKGTVYAPYARVEMNNRAGQLSAPIAYGLIWGKSVILGDAGIFYFDTALKDEFLSTDVSLVSWKESRN